MTFGPPILATVSHASEAGTADFAHLMMQFVLQLAIIIIAARLCGSLFSRHLKLPRVLGELMAGMIIGPYALGRLPIPGYGPLFPLPDGSMPVSAELYAVATLASIVLLFLSGLETDLGMFLRYSLAGTLVGFFGVIFSFVLGDLCAVWFGFAAGFMDPHALFLGAVSTATSIGITARILSERRKTDTPEGVTIMAGAVLDDVLGIIILAMVVGISQIGASGGDVDWGGIGWIALKAFGFWLACMAFTMATAKPLSRILKLSKTPATIATLTLGLALLLAGISEMAGLAMIIGAYIAGLALSRTDLAQFLHEQLHGVYMILVPAFFCVMGMLVNFSAMQGALVFGIVYTIVAIVAKVGGCAAAGWMMKFNRRGALRIGLGMLPRGEVALIVAGIGFSMGIISDQLFGVAILMTMITTLIAPPLLIKSFRGGRGIRGKAADEEEDGIQQIALEFPSPDISEFLFARLVRGFRSEEFFVHRLDADLAAYQIRKDDILFSLIRNGPEIILTTPPEHQHIARLILLEELVNLQDLLESVQKMGDLRGMETRLVGEMFGPKTP